MNLDALISDEYTDTVLNKKSYKEKSTGMKTGTFQW